MGHKGSWSRGKESSYCIKHCENRPMKCKDCYKAEHYVEIKRDGPGYRRDRENTSSLPDIQCGAMRY
jgi:hypothetical protein